MLAPALLLLQTVTQVESIPSLPPDLPHPSSEIRSALANAELDIMRAEVCTASRPSYDARVEPLRARFTSAWQSAEPLYGGRVTPRFGGVDVALPCTGKHRSRYLRDAKAALARFDRALQTRLSAMRGLWLGPIRLCRDTVESTRLVEDHDGSLQPLIRFAPAIREELRSETRARIDKPIGLYLDGELVFAPIVREEMASEMQISGPRDPKQSDRIRAAAALPC